MKTEDAQPDGTFRIVKESPNSEAAHGFSSVRFVEDDPADFDAQNESVITAVKDYADSVQKAEAKLKSLATNAYERFPATKKIIPGVEIKMFTQLGYDPKKAFDWAIEHKMALSLDTKTFEKIAPSANLDFVLVMQIPKATIATDLDKVLLNLDFAGKTRDNSFDDDCAAKYRDTMHGGK